MLKPREKYIAEGPALEAFWAAQLSGIIREMLRTAAQFALSDLGIRIVGEKGTGKLYLARLIHRESPRCQSIFTRIDCSEIPVEQAERSIFGFKQSDENDPVQTPGILEIADGGTVYFDVFEHLPAPVQDKLFRAMEMRHFRRTGGADDLNLDVRVITGTTKVSSQAGISDDAQAVPATRLGPVSINIPPLRERREDIDSLIYLFLTEYRGNVVPPVTQITAEALDFCRHYSWPGNIYELRNVIRHSLARVEGGILKPEDLPEYIRNEELHNGQIIQPVTAVRR